MVSPLQQRFLNDVNGPVYPIPTPFTETGEVNYDGLKEYVLYLLDNGARTLMVTVGTSRFDVLTIEEMKQVNETVVENAKGRAVTIVTTPTNGPTAQAIDFAQHAEEVGADGILAVFPDRFYSEDGVYQFFNDIASSTSIGVLIHLMPIKGGRSGVGPSVHYSPGLLKRLAEIENIVGLKEESLDQGMIYQYNRMLKDKLLVIGGAGGMRSYMTARQWGQPAYLVGIGNIVPDIEEKYFQALQNNDYETARSIVFENEEPFFDVAVKIGWHIALKEALSIKGLMQPWERAPMHRADMAANKQLSDVMKLCGLL